MNGDLRCLGERRESVEQRCFQIQRDPTGEKTEESTGDLPLRMFEEANARDFVLDQRDSPKKVHSKTPYLRGNHFDQIENSNQSCHFFRCDRFDRRRCCTGLIEQCVRPIGISVEKKRLKDSIPTCRTTGVCLTEKRVPQGLTEERTDLWRIEATRSTHGHSIVSKRCQRACECNDSRDRRREFHRLIRRNSPRPPDRTENNNDQSFSSSSTHLLLSRGLHHSVSGEGIGGNPEFFAQMQVQMIVGVEGGKLKKNLGDAREEKSSEQTSSRKYS